MQDNLEENKLEKLEGDKKILSADANADTLKSNSLSLDGIIKLTLRTLWWLLLSLAFLATMFVTMFPYNAMKIYSDFGMLERELESAESYLKRNESKYDDRNQPNYDSKFASAIVVSVNTSIRLMYKSIDKNGYENKTTEFYADKVIKHSDRFFLYESMRSRSNLINDYYVKNTAPSQHVNLSNFDDYVRQESIIAKYLSEGFVSVYEDIFFENLVALSENFVVNDENIDKFITGFNQLNALLNFQLGRIGYNALLTSDVDPPAESTVIQPAIQDGRLVYDAATFKLICSKYEFIEKNNDNQDITFTAGKSAIVENLELHANGFDTRIEEFKKFVIDQESEIDFTENDAKEVALKSLFRIKSVTDLITNVRNITQLLQNKSALYFETPAEGDAFYNKWEKIYSHTTEQNESVQKYYKKTLQKYINLFEKK